MRESIDQGDEVVIQFTATYRLFGTVLHVPQATGDSWQIREHRSEEDHPDGSIKCYKANPGTIHYVQQFMYMTRLSPP